MASQEPHAKVVIMNANEESIVVITGGSSGIGREIAHAFAREHSRVVIIGRNQESLAATARALGREALWF